MSIRFSPEPTLGTWGFEDKKTDKKKSIDHDILLSLVDIVCYIKGQAKDPFSVMSRQYNLHITTRENNFFIPSGEPTVSDEDEDKVEYELKFTLLPNQILIVPLAFANNITFDLADQLTSKDKVVIR